MLAPARQVQKVSGRPPLPSSVIPNVPGLLRIGRPFLAALVDRSGGGGGTGRGSPGRRTWGRRSWRASLLELRDYSPCPWHNGTEQLSYRQGGGSHGPDIEAPARRHGPRHLHASRG